MEADFCIFYSCTSDYFCGFICRL